jgi:hypothetical protein
VVARTAPLSFLASLSVASGISWILGGIWALLVALAQATAKKAATATWKRIHPDKPEPQAAKEAGKTDQAGTGSEAEAAEAGPAEAGKNAPDPRPGQDVSLAESGSAAAAGEGVALQPAQPDS